jgi:hypothetical protein
MIPLASAIWWKNCAAALPHKQHFQILKEIHGAAAPAQWPCAAFNFSMKTPSSALGPPCCLSVLVVKKAACGAHP